MPVLLNLVSRYVERDVERVNELSGKVQHPTLARAPSFSLQVFLGSASSLDHLTQTCVRLAIVGAHGTPQGNALLAHTLLLPSDFNACVVNWTLARAA